MNYHEDNLYIYVSIEPVLYLLTYLSDCIKSMLVSSKTDA